jgi:hypothetical protein
MMTYKLSPDNVQKENKKTYNISWLITRTMLQIWTNSETKKNKTRQQTIIWTKFTYIGKETKFITKLFKNINIKMTFTTVNIIDRFLSTQQKQVQNKYKKWYLLIYLPHL